MCRSKKVALVLNRGGKEGSHELASNHEASAACSLVALLIAVGCQ
jgi:hypothetical protein